MKTTAYCNERLLRNRPSFELGCICAGLRDPAKVERQGDGRVRSWGYVQGLEGRALRVVTLEDGTMHIAFSGSRFAEAGRDAMTLHCDPETDSLHIEPRADAGVDTREIEPRIVGDFDAAGHLVGLDIDPARRKVDSTSPDTIALPTPAA